MADVRPATLDDVDRLARIAAAGFYDDPVLSWVFQDDTRRLDQLTFVMTGLVGDMLPDRGTVHLADEVCAAFWRDPTFEHGRSAADRVEDTLEDAPAEQPLPFAPDELERLGILGEAMMTNHPHEPHWYLNVVSTIPDHQGRGLGSAVMRPVLERCDAEGARAYLESSNPRNLTPVPPQRLRRRGRDPAPERPQPHDDVARPALMEILGLTFVGTFSPSRAAMTTFVRDVLARGAGGCQRHGRRRLRPAGRHHPRRHRRQATAPLVAPSASSSATSTRPWPSYERPAWSPTTRCRATSESATPTSGRPTASSTS